MKPKARASVMSDGLTALYGPTGRLPLNRLGTLTGRIPRVLVLGEKASCVEAGRVFREAFAKIDFAELELRVLASGEYQKP
jgi:hypothetical protein